MSAEAAGNEGSGSILVDAVVSDASPAQVERGAAEALPRTSNEALALQDVLQDVQSDANADALGVHMNFASVGNTTVVSIETGMSGAEAPILVARIDNVTGMTLQQLLNDGGQAVA